MMFLMNGAIRKDGFGVAADIDRLHLVRIKNFSADIRKPWQSEDE